MRSSMRVLSLLMLLPTIAVPVLQAQTSPTVRDCLYVPGVSVPATVPTELVDSPSLVELPTVTPPSPSAVDAETIARQLDVFGGLWNAVNDHYVYPEFRGHDWGEIGDRYEAVIEQGLNDDSFYALMQEMLRELGDEHSYFQSPTEVAEDAAILANGQDFVGIGALFVPIAGGSSAAVVVTLPGSPAAEAGLQAHDSLLSVDGGPIRDENGISRSRGPEGSLVTLTVQRPGEEPRDITLTRRRVTGSLPVDYCLIPGTRVGYMLLPTFLDETIDDQIRAALQALTPLDGLVLDNRMNGGGLGSVTQNVLSLFTGGVHGYFVTRDSRDPLNIQPEDIGGSQAVPLVVLIGPGTVSYGEILSGVLRLAGRAHLVGAATLGNVEQLRRYDFDDGSRAWIASATFEPRGQSNGLWEDTGIVPDVLVPTRWDLFTEATDPALAAAVELLTQP